MSFRSVSLQYLTSVAIGPLTFRGSGNGTATQTAVQMLLMLLVVVNSSGCGLYMFSERKTNPVLEEEISFFRQHVGILATTPERRVVVVGLRGKNAGRFCAEPPPDAAENLASKFALAAQASVETPKARGTGELDLSKALATSVQQLFRRSQGVQLLRDGAFQLCQAWANGVIETPDYGKKTDDLLKKAYDLVELELKQAQGIIGGPPPAVLPVVSLESIETRGGIEGALRSSDRIRVNVLIEELKRRKKDTPPDASKIKLTAVDLYEILSRNANEAVEERRTLQPAEQREALRNLRPLAKNPENLTSPEVFTPKDNPRMPVATFIQEMQ